LNTGAGEFALHVLRTGVTPVVVKQILEVGPLLLERGRFHVRKVVRDRVEFLLHAEHPAPGSVNRLK